MCCLDGEECGGGKAWARWSPGGGGRLCFRGVSSTTVPLRRSHPLAVYFISSVLFDSARYVFNNVLEAHCCVMSHLLLGQVISCMCRYNSYFAMEIHHDICPRFSLIRY